MHRNQSCKSKSYEAKVSRAGKSIYLGLFATAEEAALCIARSPEGRMAAEKALSAPAPSLTAEEARQQVRVGLTLRDRVRVRVGVRVRGRVRAHPKPDPTSSRRTRS